MTPPTNISLDKILATNSFKDFVEAARNFCSLIETQKSDNPKQFLQTIQRHLLTLYTLGLDLPDIYPSTDLDTHLSVTDVKAVLKFIGDRVPFSYYWVVLNPVDEINLAETGTGDLIDDLGDIYQDIKHGLILFDKEDFNAKENAVWQFKFDYDNHWAEHCIEALGVIYHYLYENR